jgi:hypothetical protein
MTEQLAGVVNCCGLALILCAAGLVLAAVRVGSGR